MSVDIRQITKFYGKQKALDNVSFSLCKGELAGFLGPNGAGKSTLMKILTGYIPSSEGEVLINGRPMTVDHVEIKREIGYLPENNPLYSDLYVPEYLEIVAGFYKLRGIASRVKEMIGIVGLESHQNKKIGALSKGFRQRVGIAQALIHNPSVLVLDEPTSGLDPNQLEEVRSLILGISHEKTVLLSSHILQEIEAICKRVIIINNGKLVADSDLSLLKNAGMSQVSQVYVEFDQPLDPARLMGIEGVDGVSPQSVGWLVTSSPEIDIRPSLFRFAVDHGLIIFTMSGKQRNLETIFQKLTKE